MIIADQVRIGQRMNKRVGRVEIDRQPGSEWVRVRFHYNDSTCGEIQLQSVEDVHDLQYAIQSVLRDMGIEKSI